MRTDRGTEFGVPMNTGVNYDGARDGHNDVSYLYAITDTVRSQNMGQSGLDRLHYGWGTG